MNWISEGLGPYHEMWSLIYYSGMVFICLFWNVIYFIVISNIQQIYTLSASSDSPVIFDLPHMPMKMKFPLCVLGRTLSQGIPTYPPNEKSLWLSPSNPMVHLPLSPPVQMSFSILIQFCFFVFFWKCPGDFPASSQQ